MEGSSAEANGRSPSSRFPALPWGATAPPFPKDAYSRKKALDDIPALSYALHLFLASHMVESEDYCREYDPKREHLYFAAGYGLIQCFKGVMSFEDEDLVAALSHVKHGNSVASHHRKRAAPLPARLVGLVVPSLNTSGVGWIKSMTPIERHAELVYAESLFEKAILGIAYSGDWLAFIKEALNMRTTINIYRQLGKFLEAVDAEAQARGEGPEDKSVDAHFRSGVCLGVGMSNVVLSLMPSKLLTIIELFGYSGDRHAGLAYLMKPGGWSAHSEEPAVSLEQEGLRRTMCDMALMLFHLVLSNFTFEGIDIGMAQKILDYHIKRYPNGVFFLFGEGRLCMCRGQPAQAIEYYKKAMNAQNQYRNMHHISLWEMAIASFALWDIPASLQSWQVLADEATWSKATYNYGIAVCLLQIGGDDERERAAQLMAKVPNMRQRIAGKSIPLEKFVARKARKFQDQGDRLELPALEFAYFFMAIARSPREVVVEKLLPPVQDLLLQLKIHSEKPSEYAGGHGYWDDYCLAHFLQGICLRYIAYPDADTVIDPGEKLSISETEAERGAMLAFEAVIADGSKIVLDHYLIYHAHYEYGRLLACKGDKEGARRHLELVMSGKPLEGPGVTRKGKYSMENALHVRTHAALEALDHKTRL
ncbi:uncharacterized protein LAESUDRAFT_781726 [Laetiporus sulphureus 93-53]|uniref:TPR-like protein n=1 Tax=Laetiporus sulphureus 93-53 TaxID=1314785 RepID=A0A165DLL0_9APHY|nr:uncharacterized protein LAESUDRAFT_781726 [Laetiporus sulphureus 93-53]KZT05152.1 hypothetical protein LAESUDRAFT_781726 [Laetiporus sulphureus 93-53]